MTSTRSSRSHQTPTTAFGMYQPQFSSTMMNIESKCTEFSSGLAASMKNNKRRRIEDEENVDPNQQPSAAFPIDQTHPSFVGMPSSAYCLPFIGGMQPPEYGNAQQFYAMQQAPYAVGFGYPAATTSTFFPDCGDSMANFGGTKDTEEANDSGFQSDLSVTQLSRGSPNEPFGAPLKVNSSFETPSNQFVSPYTFNSSDESSQIDLSTEFCKVPSRTTLLSSKQCTVSVGEIRRRTSGPELLNGSLLGGILRKAKEKSGGKALRDELKKVGINLPSGRRKNGTATTWTCFVEEEALQMATDFSEITRAYFPVESLARQTIRRLGAEDPRGRKFAIDHTRKIIGELATLLRSDRSPVHGCENRTIILDNDLQERLSNFSAMTHGFGIPVFASMFEVVEAALNSMLRINNESLNQPGIQFYPPQEQFANPQHQQLLSAHMQSVQMHHNTMQ